MARARISSVRPWFSRMFSGWFGPEFVDDIVVPTIPYGGFGRHNELQYVTKSAINNSVVKSDPVPDGFQWWVPFCEVFHTDTGLTSNGWISLENPATQRVAISDTHSLFNNTHFGILRPLIVPEGYRLVSNIRTATTGGTHIFMNFFHVQTPIGEPIPPV